MKYKNSYIELSPITADRAKTIVYILHADAKAHISNLEQFRGFLRMEEHPTHTLFTMLHYSVDWLVPANVAKLHRLGYTSLKDLGVE